MYALLHELNHAIENYKNPDAYVKNYHSQLSIEHDKRALEIEADNFAKSEYKKVNNTLL